tara:strand:+ start:8719 stop:9720 length:1002 start_codon:yes stop_codon:yes gene_type:complete
MTKKYDYIIIGQGITGSALAWKLNYSNKKFLILDSENKNTASKAALGIYNPITGRRKALTWNVNELFENLERFYLNVEKEIGVKILFKKNIYRPINNNKDFNDWNSRMSNVKFQSIIKEIDEKKAITKKSGYIDVKKYLTHTRKYFKKKERYHRYKLDDKDIIIENNEIRLKGFQAKHIVMCIGIDQKKINLFNKIDINEVSGNSILAELNYSIKNIINNKISIVNTSKNIFHIGSSYNNGSDNIGHSKILDDARKIIKKKLIFKKSFFGIRSSSKDRRPIVGKHFQLKNLYIINGLGSKGISQAPYCSDKLFNYIERNKQIDKEININRFKT